MKRTLSLVLALVMLLGTIPVFAAETAAEKAEFLESIEVLKGNTEGDLMLAAELKREDSVVMLARLLGLEEAAVAWEDGPTWTDLPVNPYYESVLGWAQESGYYQGHSNVRFGFGETITANDFALVLLRALGIAEIGDDSWLNAYETAVELGIITEDMDVAKTGKLLRGDMAVMVYAALGTEMAEGGETLAESLGIEMPVTELALVKAEVVNKDEIKVTFNSAVEEGLQITLMRGLVPYTTTNTWNEDLTELTMKSSFALPAADYTVKVGEFTATVKVEAEKAVTLTINSIGLQNITEAPLNVSLLNQYGKDMAVSGLNVTAYNITKGVQYATAYSAATGWTVNLTTPTAAAVNDIVVVSVVDATSGLTATKNLTVIAASAYSSFKFDSVVMPANQTRLLAGSYEVKYTLLNQYSDSVKLTAGTFAANTVKDGLLLSSSDALVVPVTGFAVDATGKLTMTTGTKVGSATITSVVVATGQVSTWTVTVEGASAVKTFTVAAPASLVVAGEDVVIPYVAIDQYGVQIAPKDHSLVIGTSSGLTFGSSNSTVIHPDDFEFNYKNELVLNATDDGTSTIYVYLNGVLQNSIVLSVEKEAVATRITGVKNFPTMFEVGSASKTLVVADNLTIVDQYNRVFTEAVTVNASKVNTALSNVTMSALTFGPATVGSQTIRFMIGTDTTSALDVVMGTVESKDVVSYELSAAGTMYIGTTKQLTLTGKTASGQVVNLKTDKVTNNTSTNTSIAAISNSMLVTAGVKGEATVAVWSGATKLAEVVVTVSDAAKVPTTVTFDKAVYELTTAVPTAAITVTVKDQYGVSMPVSGFWASSNEAVVTVSGGTLTKVAAGQATITFVTTNGIVTTVPVVVY